MEEIKSVIEQLNEESATILADSKDIETLAEEEKLELLEIVKYPNSKLTESSAEVLNFGDCHTELIRNMLYTMKMHNGISISAPSVGVQIQLILINIGLPVVMFNPVIIGASAQTNNIEEGTISIPDFFYTVDRYESIDIVYQNELGNRIQSHVTGLNAAAIQHEMDILNGKIYLDNLKTVKKFFEGKKIKKHIKNR